MKNLIISKNTFLLGTVIATLLLWITVPPLSAAFLINGTLYYSDPITNNIYEKTVMPGDTIVQDHLYDLTYVSGSSKKFAWWKDKNVEGTTCTPDIINSISYIDTNGNVSPDRVYLDPEKWPTGNWWQWDGCYQMKFQRNHPEPQYTVYMQDNNLMFHIIKDPNPPMIVTVPTPAPTRTATPIPTTTAPTPTATPVPVKTDEGWPLWYYPVGFIGLFIGWRLLW